MSDFEPTRRCPHPWCGRLHVASGCLSAVVFVQIVFSGLASLLFMLLMSAITVGVMRLQAGKPLIQEAIDEQTERALGVQLTVRPGWAFAAVTCDGVFTLFLGASLVRLFMHPYTISVPDASADSFATIGVALGVVAFAQYAHRKATRPAKLQRLTMPAATDTV